jgi:hypothetical protein
MNDDHELPAAQMTDVSVIRRFVLGGNAKLTLRSKTTGTRFTFHIRQPEADRPHFVKVLTGPEKYTFLGTIFKGENFVHGKRSPITADALSAKAFGWFWNMLQKAQLPIALEVWHEGRCCRCGRELTVPESIASGIGPECAKKYEMKPIQEELSDRPF